MKILVYKKRIFIYPYFGRLILAATFAHTTLAKSGCATIRFLKEKLMTNPEEWDRHSILARLRREGMTLAGLAERYGLSTSGVKNIWTRPNEKVERAIAKFLNVPVEKLFKDRYPKTRNRILSPKYKPQASRGAAVDPSRRDAA